MKNFLVDCMKSNMKKGLIKLRTGREYTPGLFKEEYEDEIVDAGFEVDYESFGENEKRKLV
jgi:hypothetical protein